MSTITREERAAEYPWAVLDNDGIVINRFKTEAAAQHWGKGFYHRLVHLPVPEEYDII